MEKVKSISKKLLVVICGVVYGVVSLYWLALGSTMLFNLFGEDNGHYEEYAFLKPFGAVMILLYLVITGLIAFKLKKKKKLLLYFGSAIVFILLFYIVYKIKR